MTQVTNEHATRVLVAEDSDDTRAVVAAILRDDGFDVVEARSGIELLQRLGVGDSPPEDRHVDLVISDVRMPNLDGIEALAEARRAEISTPFILMSAYGGRGAQQRARELRAVMFLKKPFSLFELRDAVRAILDPAWW
jgi:CheY-like chemotaxis protein